MIDTMRRRPVGDLSRRHLLIAGSIAIPAVLTACEAPLTPGPDGVIPPTLASGTVAQREAALPPTAPTVFYVTAPDCPNCTQWHYTYQPDFEKSDERAHLRFIVLHSPTIHDGSGQDVTWPAKWRWVRDALKTDKRPKYRPITRYTPLWALIRQHEYVAGASGIEGWKTVMWPAIQKVAGHA